MLVGLTGKNAAGKGAVAEYLVAQHKFTYYSLSGANDSYQHNMDTTWRELGGRGW